MPPCFFSHGHESDDEASDKEARQTWRHRRKVVTQPTRSADMDSAERATVPFGRETCGPLELAEQHECLVANGIGGFASGTTSVVRFKREALRHHRPARLPLSNDGASTVSKRQAESQNNSASHF
jgi:hypothetical protein